MLLLVGGIPIGFLLAALGAGGSILLLPLLVSGAGMPTQEAVPLSMLVVALLSIGNLGPYLKRHQVAPRAALVLGIPPLAGAWFMLRRDIQEQRPRNEVAQPREPAPALALAGEGVVLGLLTGVAGVGGGSASLAAISSPAQPSVLLTGTRAEASQTLLGDTWIWIERLSGDSSNPLYYQRITIEA